MAGRVYICSTCAFSVLVFHQNHISLIRRLILDYLLNVFFRHLPWQVLDPHHTFDWLRLFREPFNSGIDMLSDWDEATSFFLHLLFLEFTFVFRLLILNFFFLNFIGVVAICWLREVILDVVLIFFFFFTIEFLVLLVVLICVLLARDIIKTFVISVILIVALFIEVVTIRIIEVPVNQYKEIELIIIALICFSLHSA